MIDNRFYVSALEPLDAYLTVVGKNKKLDLSKGVPRDWFKIHSCIGIAIHQRSHRSTVMDAVAKYSLEEIPKEDYYLLLSEGIIGTVEIISCKWRSRQWYTLKIGRTKMLRNPFPLLWRSQLKELPEDTLNRFLEYTGYETW